MRTILKTIATSLTRVGFDLNKLLAFKYILRFLKDRRAWLAEGGGITKNHPVLIDYNAQAGQAGGHYFHQDLLVAGEIFKKNPVRHLDIGSRIDGFVAHVASFREIEVVDVRPLVKSEHHNIRFLQADLMQPQKLGKSDSISCLHAIEHFGLGRYGDKIDVEGHIKGISNLVSLLLPAGTLYLSFPIGRNDEVHFNAHRIFNPKSILNHPKIREMMKLVRFDYVDDVGRLHRNINLDDSEIDCNFGCGIYTFEKIIGNKTFKKTKKGW